MQIYLDYNATTPIAPAARAAVVEGLELYNPSSVHGFGRAARQAVSAARGLLADYLSVRPAQIIFTSGATESINMAMRGAPTASVFIGAAEHEAVRASAPDAAIIPVNAQGVLDTAHFASLLAQSPAPSLVAVQMVNNETGVIQPIAEIIKIAHRAGAMVLVDAVQAMGKIDLSPLRAADMIALSAHKIGGPKGVGALVLRESLAITPLITGGGQEERRRAGTENVAAIMGFGAAVESLSHSMDKQKDLAAWRDAMEAEIGRTVPQAKIFNGAARVANTSMIALPGMAASTQLMNLDLAGFAVSSGSACSSGKVTASHSLLAMGEPPEIAGCAIRISSGWATEQHHYTSFAEAYARMAERLSHGLPQ